MSQAIDWKSRYRDFLHESEAKEHQQRAHAQSLRRLLLRLCELASGREPELDPLLLDVAEAARNDAGTHALDSLADSLGAVAPAPGDPPSALRQTRDALEVLVRGLSPVNGGPHPQVPELLGALKSTRNDRDLGQLVLRVLDVVRDQAAQPKQEQHDATAILEQVTARLDDVAGFLAGASEERRVSLDAAETLRVKVLAEVSDLSAQVRDANELDPVKSLVGAHVEQISSQVQDFQAREAERLRDFTERNDAMRQRVIDLERQAQRLRRDLEEERQRARLDPLTGLANRAAFEERLAEAVERNRRFGTQVSLLLWDLDRFKAINDTCGHRAGDRVLREVARCLKTRLRTTDFVARIGGEEFVALLVGTPGEQALRVAEDLRKGVEALRLHFHGTPVPVTASCGIAELVDGDSPISVFDRADAALYRAKGAGRNACIGG
jgi:diguanylate cyclase